MIYLQWYFGVGFILITAFLIESRFNKKAQKNRDLYKSIRARKRTLVRKFVDEIILPVIGLLIAFFVWPFVVIWLIWEKYKTYKYEHREKKKEEPFSVKKEDLIKKLSIKEIENKEMTSDPLKAAPDVPFGFLNKKWTIFIKNMNPSDEIWSFSSQWQSEWGRNETYEGYVIVESGDIKTRFTSVAK